MNKKISIFLAIFIIFSFAGNSLALNNEKITEKQDYILLELQSISKQIFSKQKNNIENLKKLHNRIISLDEKIDTGRMDISKKAKSKFKILSKDLVIKILNKKKEIKKEGEVVSVLLNEVFEKNNNIELSQDISMIIPKKSEPKEIKKELKIVSVLLNEVFKKNNNNIKEIVQNIPTIIFQKPEPKENINILSNAEKVIDNLIMKILNDEFKDDISVIYNNDSNYLISYILDEIIK